jgi:hypothetical protein
MTGSSSPADASRVRSVEKYSMVSFFSSLEVSLSALAVLMPLLLDDLPVSSSHHSRISLSLDRSIVANNGFKGNWMFM